MDKTGYQSYIQEIRRFNLLSADEECALAKRIGEGDDAARIKLVKCNLRLVVSIARKFNTSQVSVMDLIQEGNLGLMTAASKYKTGFNTRFSTYAYSWIMQYMLRYLHNKCSCIALPHRKDELLRRIASAQSVLFQQTGHEPSVQELSVYLDIPVKALCDLCQFSYSVSSLDTECSDDSSTTVGDIITDMTYAPETLMMKEIRCKEIHDLISKLPEKEQLVIYKRYNFDYERKPKTLREFSRILGVSAETVRQMEIRAIHHMRKSSVETQ